MSVYPLTSALPSSANVVSRWLLDEASGQNAADAVGSNTLTQVNTVGSGTGYSAPGASFDNSRDLEKGSSHYFNIANASQTGLNITGSMTIAAWIKMESGGFNRTIVAKDEEDSNRRQYQLRVVSDLIRLKVSTDGINDVNVDGATTLTSDGTTWYHVVGVFRAGSDMEVYVNGVSDGVNSTSIPASINSSTGAFTLGVQSLVAGPFDLYDGLLQDVIIWNVALSDANVDALYDLYQTAATTTSTTTTTSTSSTTTTTTSTSTTRSTSTTTSTTRSTSTSTTTSTTFTTTSTTQSTTTSSSTSTSTTITSSTTTTIATNYVPELYIEEEKIGVVVSGVTFDI